jgi:hypothetical protein
MQLHVIKREDMVFCFFSDVAVGDATSIDHVDRSISKHREIAEFFYYDGSVLIKADTKDARILRYGSEEAPHAAPFHKMLIDDDVPNKAQTARDQL